MGAGYNLAASTEHLRCSGHAQIISHFLRVLQHLELCIVLTKPDLFQKLDVIADTGDWLLNMKLCNSYLHILDQTKQPVINTKKEIPSIFVFLRSIWVKPGGENWL